jgi:hypothetical protein
MDEIQLEIKKLLDQLPKEFHVPNPYNIPYRVQGKENNCTSISFAHLFEYQLSDYFRERTIMDVDDLWEKQKKFGTATEEGDFMEGPFLIATKYGARFRTDSDDSGTIYLSGKKMKIFGVTTYTGWRVKMDKPFRHFFKFLWKRRNNLPSTKPETEQDAYNKEIYKAFGAGTKSMGYGSNKILISTKMSAIADDAILAVKDLDQFNITIDDEEETLKAIRKVKDKFSKPRFGGTGGTGGPLPDGFYDLSRFVLFFVVQWITSHVLKDLDDGIWNSVKSVLKKLFESLKKLGKDEDNFAVMLSQMPIDKSAPTVVFIFPKSLPSEEFAKALDIAREITIRTVEDYSIEKGIAVYEYTYLQSESKWHLQTTRFSGVL